MGFESKILKGEESHLSRFELPSLSLYLSVTECICAVCFDTRSNPSLMACGGGFDDSIDHVPTEFCANECLSERFPPL